MDKAFKAPQAVQDLQNEYKALIGKFYDSLALYSAGTISLTATAILPLVNAHPEAFSGTIYRIPSICILYLSWISLTICFLSSLLSRKYEALRLPHEASKINFRHKAEVFKERSKLAAIQPDIIEKQNWPGKGDYVVWSGRIAEVHGGIADKYWRKEKLFFKITKALQFIAQSGIILGIVSLLIFILMISNSPAYLGK